MRVMKTVEMNGTPDFQMERTLAVCKTEGGQTSRGPMEIRPMTQVGKLPNPNFFFFPQRPDKMG